MVCGKLPLKMRIVAAILLLITVIIHILLGSTYLLSSKYKKMEARTNAGDLSLVGQDLLDEAELSKEREKVDAKTKQAGKRQLVFGILTLFVALIEILAGVLLLIKKAHPVVLGIISLGIVGMVAMMVFDGLLKISLISVIFLAVALIVSWRIRPSALPPVNG